MQLFISKINIKLKLVDHRGMQQILQCARQRNANFPSNVDHGRILMLTETPVMLLDARAATSSGTVLSIFEPFQHMLRMTPMATG